MKRGIIRLTKIYVKEDGQKKIKWQIQGRKNGVWLPVTKKGKYKEEIDLTFDDMIIAKEEFEKILKEAGIKANVHRR